MDTCCTNTVTNYLASFFKLILLLYKQVHRILTFSDFFLPLQPSNSPEVIASVIPSYNKVMPADDEEVIRALTDAFLDSLYFRCAPYTMALLNPSKCVRVKCIIWRNKGEGDW